MASRREAQRWVCVVEPGRARKVLEYLAGDQQYPAMAGTERAARGSGDDGRMAADVKFPARLERADWWIDAARGGNR